eukprot:g2930.t1
MNSSSGSSSSGSGIIDDDKANTDCNGTSTNISENENVTFDLTCYACNTGANIKHTCSRLGNRITRGKKNASKEDNRNEKNIAESEIQSNTSSLEPPHVLKEKLSLLSKENSKLRFQNEDDVGIESGKKKNSKLKVSNTLSMSNTKLSTKKRKYSKIVEKKSSQKKKAKKQRKSIPTSDYAIATRKAAKLAFDAAKEAFVWAELAQKILFGGSFTKHENLLYRKMLGMTTLEKLDDEDEEEDCSGVSSSNNNNNRRQSLWSRHRGRMRKKTRRKMVPKRRVDKNDSHLDEMALKEKQNLLRKRRRIQKRMENEKKKIEDERSILLEALKAGLDAGPDSIGLLGKVVSVSWIAENAWYVGRVIGSHGNQSYSIHYADGCVLTHNLRDTEHRVITPDEEDNENWRFDGDDEKSSKNISKISSSGEKIVESKNLKIDIFSGKEKADKSASSPSTSASSLSRKKEENNDFHSEELRKRRKQVKTLFTRWHQERNISSLFNPIEKSENQKNLPIQYRFGPMKRVKKLLRISKSPSQQILIPKLARCAGGINLGELAFGGIVCKICGQGENDDKHDDKILLCDTCDKGFHMFCLRPILVNIPKGSWHCDACKLKNPNLCNEKTGSEDAKFLKAQLNFLGCSRCDSGDSSHSSSSSSSSSVLATNNSVITTTPKPMTTSSSLAHVPSIHSVLNSNLNFQNLLNFFNFDSIDQRILSKKDIRRLLLRRSNASNAKACVTDSRKNFRIAVPSQTLGRRCRQMAAIASALSAKEMKWSNQLKYKSPTEALCNIASIQNIQKMDKTNLRIVELFNNLCNKGQFPPLLVRFHPEQGFVVEADDIIEDRSIICEYVGNVCFLSEANKYDNDSIMELLWTGHDDTSLVVAPQTFGNYARFISGINNQKVDSKAKQNVRSVRFSIKGETRVFLFACKKIMKGERLYYDYNAYGSYYPTDNFS